VQPTAAYAQDEPLWSAFRRGDERAFAQLYDQYFTVLFRYGLRLSGEVEQTQDAVQDLFVDLWRTRERLGHTTSVKFYLFRALRRRLHQASVFEGQFVRPEQVASGGFLWPTVDDAESEQIAAETARQQQQHLHHWLQKLPPRQLEVIQLRFYDEFSFAQIADIMSMNEQSVRNLLGRALHNLREHLTLLLAALLLWATG